MRDHTPKVIEEFNGLFRRGDPDSCPQDHFSDCNNVQYSQSSVKTRDGIDPFIAFPNVVMMYKFTQQTGESILALDAAGNIFDSGSPTPSTPILSISGMIDFGFVSVSGRALLSPVVQKAGLPNNGKTGKQNEFVYIYDGTGTPARLAAGVGPKVADGNLAAANSATAGNVEAGIHIFGAVYETKSGYLTNIGPTDATALPTVTADGTHKVDISNIPVSGSSAVTKVHLVATVAIDPTLYTGDTRGYEFFFIPGAVVNNGTTTLTVNFFDSDLLEDATHLQDLFDKIPAVAGMTTYRGRVVYYATYNDISIAYISEPGEPEAVNQVSGIIIFPLDGRPITNAQEFRGILYVFKQTRTRAWSDNGDVPSSWVMNIIDDGIGSALHGIAFVLDADGVNIEFIIVADYSGMMIFNGFYSRPELSWKIQDLWFGINRDDFDKIQVMNDTVSQILYIKLPTGTLIMGNYSNNLDHKDIRWSPWSFDITVTSIALINTNVLILASD